MKLSLIRYTKMAFIFLRLHVLFNPFASLFLNLYCLTKLSAWIAGKGKRAANDFPSRWSYEKRYELYEKVVVSEGLGLIPINYLEFGVAAGHSFRWFLKQNTHPGSRFYGFDTFTGLPEDWGSLKKGSFSTGNKPPEIDDARGKFYQGLFQQTIHKFLPELDPAKRNVLMLDADIYSATLYTLASLAPFLKKDDIIFFDEFAVPTHEFRAFSDFTQSFLINLEPLAAANNFYFTVFKVA